MFSAVWIHNLDWASQVFLPTLQPIQVWLLRLWTVNWKGNQQLKCLSWKYLALSLSDQMPDITHWSSYVSLLQPSEHNTYADIEAAYKCLEESYGAKQEDIILYGQSVGSGPTLDLAARLPQLKAVVLHSPILSGLRVMYPVKRTYWFDIYKVRNFLLICPYNYIKTSYYSPPWHIECPKKLTFIVFCIFKKKYFAYPVFEHAFVGVLQNIDKIPLVKCPVLVIHVSIQFLIRLLLNWWKQLSNMVFRIDAYCG